MTQGQLRQEQACLHGFLWWGLNPGGQNSGSLSPHTWLLVDHVQQKEEDNSNGDESRPPGKKEHDDHGDHCSKQCCPLAIVAEGGSPPWVGPGSVHVPHAQELPLGPELQQGRAAMPQCPGLCPPPRISKAPTHQSSREGLAGTGVDHIPVWLAFHHGNRLHQARSIQFWPSGATGHGSQQECHTHGSHGAMNGMEGEDMILSGSTAGQAMTSDSCSRGAMLTVVYVIGGLGTGIMMNLGIVRKRLPWVS